MGVKFSNNAKTTLSASVSTSATSVSVASSSGFPSLSGGDYFYATMVQQADDTALEIVKVTAVSGTTWTVSRAQDNTSAGSFASGDKIELRASAGVFIDLFAEKAPIANPTFTGNLTIGSAEISETELEILDGATVTTAELNKLDGTTATAASLTYGKDLYDTGVTATEFDYLDGVTSNIQTQISTKLTTPSGFARGSVIIGDSSGNPANLGAGANGYVLKSDGTDVTWAEDEKTTTTNFVKNAFTGDNTTTAFTLSQSPNSEDNLIVFIEGVFQNQGDYSLSGTTLTFDEAPATGRKIVAYHVKAAVSGANLNHDQFTASGSAAFTLSITPINENNTQVFIDGVYQQKTDYSVSGTTLTFDTAPTSGAIVEVMTFTQTEINVPTTGSVVTASIVNDVNLNGNPTTTTQSAGNNTTRIATTAFVETAVSNLIDSAPGTMNTLNEIAAALGDDPTFTTTVNNAIALKAPLASPTFTGDAVFDTTTLKVDATNNRVGIGTTSPANKLAVNGAISIEAAASAAISEGLLIDYSTNLARFLTYDSSTGSEIAFYTQPNGGSTTQALRIDSSQNSTFAGTISSSDISITSAGASLSLIDSDNNPDYQIKNGNGAFRIIDTTNSVDRINISSSGNVGIGTSSPDDLLDVENGNIRLRSNSEGNTGLLRMFDASGTESAQIYPASGDLKIYSPNDVLFTQSGNVGIGTTNPYSGTNVTSLTVSAASYPSVALQISGTTAGLLMANSAGLDVYATGNKVMNFITNDTTRMSIDSTGVNVTGEITLSDKITHGNGVLDLYDASSNTTLKNGITNGNVKLQTIVSGVGTANTLIAGDGALGQVDLPYQSGFHAYSPAVTNGGGNVIIFGGTHHNTGSDYNTSNGKFTAPRSGRYLVTASVLINPGSTSSYERILFGVNENAASTQFGDTLCIPVNTSYQGLNISCVITLDANDYVRVYNMGQSPTYGTAYGSFSGFYLG